MLPILILLALSLGSVSAPANGTKDIAGAGRRAVDDLIVIAITVRVDRVIITGDVFHGDWSGSNWLHRKPSICPA
jgi:metallophosphoesterase superfamily enzyme